MVKEQPREITREITLDPKQPLAREYPSLNNEQVTVPDFSISIQSMVLNGTAGQLAQNSQHSGKYNYPTITGDDETDHNTPDYGKIKDGDLTERDEFVNEFLTNPDNYEKIQQTTQDPGTGGNNPSSKNEDKPS